MTSAITRDVPPEFLISGFDDIKRKRVLIVDCHSAMRGYLRSQLSMLGVKQVQSAVSSADVLRLVRQSEFDIILCDYMLEDGRDGQQLLEELRRKQLIAVTTIFMIVSGERAYKSVVAVAELGPDDYLIKPFTADQLNSRLLRALYRRRVFAQVHRHIERNEPDAALAECDRIAGREESFFFDAMRMKAEILNAQGRHDESEAIYRMVLERKVIPWAKMGLAFAAFHLGKLDEAQSLAESLIEDFPEYLGAYDFLGKVLEKKGDTGQAQAVLEEAARISPQNTRRQRDIGDLAVCNGDLDSAEKAYATVLSRRANVSFAAAEDYASLARVRLDRGDVAGAASVSQSMRRELKGDREAELASLVVDSLCAKRGGEETRAAELLEQALSLHGELTRLAGDGGEPPRSLSMDLAHACLENGRPDLGESLLRKVAAENPEDGRIAHRVRSAFAAVGRDEDGARLLSEVGEELVRVNNEGVLRARQGDIEGAVELLMRAADGTPNLQFLVNAAKAIFTLLELKGWDEPLALRAMRYLQTAADRDPHSARLAGARDLMRRVESKYGIRSESPGGGPPR